MIEKRGLKYRLIFPNLIIFDMSHVTKCVQLKSGDAFRNSVQSCGSSDPILMEYLWEINCLGGKRRENETPCNL